MTKPKTKKTNRGVVVVVRVVEIVVRKKERR